MVYILRNVKSPLQKKNSYLETKPNAKIRKSFYYTLSLLHLIRSWIFVGSALLFNSYLDKQRNT